MFGFIRFYRFHPTLSHDLRNPNLSLQIKSFTRQQQNPKSFVTTVIIPINPPLFLLIMSIPNETLARRRTEPDDC